MFDRQYWHGFSRTLDSREQRVHDIFCDDKILSQDTLRLFPRRLTPGLKKKLKSLRRAKQSPAMRLEGEAFFRVKPC